MLFHIERSVFICVDHIFLQRKLLINKLGLSFNLDSKCAITIKNYVIKKHKKIN